MITANYMQSDYHFAEAFKADDIFNFFKGDISAPDFIANGSMLSVESISKPAFWYSIPTCSFREAKEW
jgi:hypothetical protein